MRFIAKTLLSICFVVLATASSVLACTCDMRPPACYEYLRTPTIFLGKIASVIRPETSPFERVLINVSENFLGMDSPLAETYNDPGHSCMHQFKADETYLFYGDLDKEKINKFGTSYCTRTTEDKDATADLEFLRAVKANQSLYWIWGTVSETGYDPPLAGIRAEVLNVRPKLQATSDENGNIKLDVGKPGKYKVRVHLPKGRSFINLVFRNERQLWEENRKQMIGGRFEGNRPYVDYQLEVRKNRCGWFDVSVPREIIK